MARGWKRAAARAGRPALRRIRGHRRRGDARAGQSVNVAFIYPKTGGLAAFGGEEFDGFQAGLAYANGKCGGYTINPTYIDDATDPATAINAFKNRGRPGHQDRRRHRLVGHRAAARRRSPRRTTCSTSPAAAASDAHHRPQPEHVPRRPADAAGRPRRGEHLPAEGDGQEGRRLRRGHGVRRGQRRRREARSSAARGTRSRRSSSPFGAADLTPYAQQLRTRAPTPRSSRGPDTTNAAAMWQSLQQQGVAKQLTLVTGLANRASYDALGPLVAGRHLHLALRLRRRRTTR